ncbi:MAG: type II toxin-antitoxin system HicB family antitoxin [Ktedonobacterales bacterium]
MHIAWSERDGAYLITLPEWSSRLLNSVAVTHGAPYEEAAHNGQEVIEMLIEDAQERGEALPAPQTITYDPVENVADAATRPA